MWFLEHCIAEYRLLSTIRCSPPKKKSVGQRDSTVEKGVNNHALYAVYPISIPSHGLMWLPKASQDKALVEPKHHQLNTILQIIRGTRRQKQHQILEYRH